MPQSHRRAHARIAAGLFAGLGTQVGAWAVLIPDLVATRDLTPAALGAALALMAATSIGALAAAGPVADRLGRRPLAVGGAAGFAAAFALLATVESQAAVWPTVALYGVASGALDLAANAIGSDYERAHRVRAMIRLHAGFSAAAAAAALGAAALAAATSAPAAYGAVAALYVALAAAATIAPLPPHEEPAHDARGHDQPAGAGHDPPAGLGHDPPAGPGGDPPTGPPHESSVAAARETGGDSSPVLRDSTPVEHDSPPAVRDPIKGSRPFTKGSDPCTGSRSRGALLRTPGVAIAVGLCTLCFFGDGAIEGYAALFLREVLESGSVVTGAALAAFHGASLVGRLLWARVADARGEQLVLTLAGVMASGGMVVTVAASAPAAAAGGLLLVGFALAPIVPTALSLAARSAPGRSATAVSLVTTVGYSAFVAGPPLVGALASVTSLRVALVPVVASTAAIALLARRVR